jgi:hypothetical protein
LARLGLILHQVLASLDTSASDFVLKENFNSSSLNKDVHFIERVDSIYE